MANRRSPGVRSSSTGSNRTGWLLTVSNRLAYLPTSRKLDSIPLGRLAGGWLSGQVSAAVVVSAGSNAKFVVADLVHQPVFVRDAAGPVSVEPVFEGFGLADALVPVALHVLDQRVDPFKDLAVRSEERRVG